LSAGGPLRFLVLRDHKENVKKCTLSPLEGREGVTFVRLGPEETFLLDRGMILDVEGPPLGPGDRGLARRGPIVVLDASWARVSKVRRRLVVPPGAPIERRSIPREIVTAYPRASKLYTDPAGGLASIEAVYAASAILGEPSPDLLTQYPWAEEFLARNRDSLPFPGTTRLGEGRPLL
jgi:pre-rRNA-processing protein TSR3